jgi:hypothetical protein
VKPSKVFSGKGCEYPLADAGDCLALDLAGNPALCLVVFANV